MGIGGGIIRIIAAVVWRAARISWNTATARGVAERGAKSAILIGMSGWKSDSPEGKRGMTIIERPNKNAVTDATDIYRDAMRPFTLRNLKRIRGMDARAAIRNALSDSQLAQFDQNIQNGRSIEDAIDVSDIARIIRRYWRDAFRDSLPQGTDLRDSLSRITEIRNEASHPESEDIETKRAIDVLDDISEVLRLANAPDEAARVESIRDGLKPFSTPAHKFRQGGRDVYAFSLDLETLDNLLPERVDVRMVRDANRPLTPSHAKEIQDYLRERDDWLLGTLLLGISPEYVRFEPYYDAGEDAASAVGVLTIRDEGAREMKMFDGQHRRQAIKDALKELSHHSRHAAKLRALKDAALPVMLYAEDSIDALRQMFADAAKTRSIERNTVARFDMTDAFNQTALEIANESDFFKGRVEMERPTVARTSPHIIAINQLAATLKTLEVGYGGRVSRARNDGYMLELDALFERCWTWADDFMPSARSEYNDIMSGEIDSSDLPTLREETMAFNATVIRIFAGVYHEWLQQGLDPNLLAKFLHEASLKPRTRRGSLLVDAGAVPPGATAPTATRYIVQDAIAYIVKKAKDADSRAKQS